MRPTGGTPTSAARSCMCPRVRATTRHSRGRGRSLSGAQPRRACRSSPAPCSSASCNQGRSRMHWPSRFRSRAPGSSRGRHSAPTAPARILRPPGGSALPAGSDADVSALGLPLMTRMMAEAVQRYGMIVRDRRPCPRVLRRGSDSERIESLPRALRQPISDRSAGQLPLGSPSTTQDGPAQPLAEWSPMALVVIVDCPAP